MAVNHVWDKFSIKPGEWEIYDKASDKIYYWASCPLADEVTYASSYSLDSVEGYNDYGANKVYGKPGENPVVGYYVVRYAGSVPYNGYYLATVTKINPGTFSFMDGSIYCHNYSEHRRAKVLKNNFLGTVKSVNKNAYPDDGVAGSYWYVYRGLDNTAPTISGNDLDLRSKTDDFSIEYLVSDPDNDTCTVDIFVDNVKKISGQRVSLNTKYNYQIKVGDFTLGKHNIRITATDSKGASATRTYTFTKSNTAPTISGSDKDLGGRSTAFTENYRVSDKNNDDVAVTITLDDLEIATLSSAQDKELSFTITDSQLLAMEIGSTHTVTIKADDGKGGVAYRRYTFTKINRPPIISGADSDLGKKKTEFTQSFSFTDVEKNKIYCRVYLDDRKVYENLEVVDSKTYSYRIPHEEFIQLRYGKHEIKIEAWDDYSVDKKEYRMYSFERISNGLEVEVKINEFNVQPKKIIAVPHGIFASDAIMKVYACNNYMDSSPTWEDISSESKAARAHAFTNTSKSNSKWSIGIKVIVENGKSGVGSVLRGIKGGYE